MTDLVADWAEESPAEIAFYRKVGSGDQARWEPVTISEFRDQVVALAKGLAAAGIEAGDRVALMSRTRYEWTLIDVAIWFAGAVTVPVYETSSAEQMDWILSDSGAKALFIESSELHDSVSADDQVEHSDSTVQHLWIIDEGLEDLASAGAQVDDAEIERRCRSLTLAHPATIIYTSGTTGRPKGCVLLHRNLYVLSVNTATRLADVVSAPDAKTLLVLPLAHVFARFIQALVLAARCPMGHSPDVREAVADFGTFKPTYILSVPRIFEKIYTSAEQRAASDGKGKIFHASARVAIAYSRALDSGGPSALLRAQHFLFDKLVYSRLRTTLGGRLKYAVSGGGPLGERLGHFYHGCGLTVLEGYGLTESTAPTCVNVPEKVKIGTVGPQLPGNSVRISDDGEILLKGPHIFRQYWNNPDATAESFSEDGWFYTGDLGSLDSEGYLSITGRRKEIIVTASGKNVVPTILEDRLRSHALISQAVVVGDHRPFVGALLTLDADMLPTWLSNHDLPEMTVAQAAQDETVRTSLQAAIDRANKAVSRAESIRKFVVLDDDFTIDSGHLTPSLKLKRNVVLKDFEDAVERVYA